MSPEPERVPAWVLWGVTLVAAAALVLGWRTFWFLTDDAFIAFRYVSNDMAGYGLVWNPPPFRPVEGYTSFLWVTLLGWWWTLTGQAPPGAANGISLVCGAASLWIVARMVLRMRLAGERPGERLSLLLLVLFGTLANRTFLTWLSSGLETALFNLCMIGWISAALRWTPNLRSYVPLAVWAALGVLARPDGILLVIATVLLAAYEVARASRRTEAMRSALFALVPVLTVATHMLWRHSFYGEWLPNTYYAKHVGAWPESGWRYLLSFVVEYGVWFWALMVVAACARGFSLRFGPSVFRAAVVVGVLVVHAGYYAFVIGGDHFEYRVLSHLPPLLFLSAAWLASRLRLTPWVQTATVALFVLVSLPVQWTHWSLTKDLHKRRQTHVMKIPVADEFPVLVRPLLRRWDAWQAWLITHHVGMRHQEHKVFYQVQRNSYPSREEGARLGGDRRLVTAAATVGVPGWVYPNVAIVDLFGLNDHVIARHRVSSDQQRLMAHDREPPPGYLECLRPNVRFEKKRTVFLPQPLGSPTDSEIRACEHRDWTD